MEINKDVIVFGLLILLLSSCNTKQNDENENRMDSVANVVNKDSINTSMDTHFSWIAEIGDEGIVMKRSAPLTKDSLHPQKLINKFRSMYPDILLSLDKLSNDSIYISIRKSSYLTQQMGSTGAEAYLAELTYNLTEIPGIAYVNMDFKPGDHAMPGTYSRTDFIHR
jgi:hypothetical protein